MDKVDITVIGAGVVGLAIAAELSKKYDNIIVLDRHNTYGQETSSRNSEVIHSGIYYSQSSLKARLCIEGAEQLYDICKRHSVPYRKLGKLIVATEQPELKILDALFKRGKNNNAEGLRILDKNEIIKIEPNVSAIAALYSPNTGIINAHALMKYLFNVAESNGVLFAFNSEVNGISKIKDGFIVSVKQEGYQLKTGAVINSAGLSSDYIAGLSGINISKNNYKLNYCKGSYFSYAKPSPVQMLVYPVPHEELAGLGVHATLDLGNRLRFGPDAEYVESIDYKVDKNKKDFFYEGASKIISGLDKDSFLPDMAGIRPKLHGAGEKSSDFIIKEESDNGLEGLINLIGIESPGLTASPAIAKMVLGMMSEILN